jgi:hypothetical protein
LNYSRPAIAINRRPVTSRAPLPAPHNASCVFTERANKSAYHLQPSTNCGDTAPTKQKGLILSCFCRDFLVQQVPLKFRIQCSKEATSRPKIYSWHNNFVETGCSVRHAKTLGRPCVSDATVEQFRESFVRSPRKSARRSSLETGIPNVIEWRYENVYT